MLACNYLKRRIVNICLIFVIGFFLLPAQAEAAALACYSFGDVNNDGLITGADKTAVLNKVAVGDTTTNSYSNIRADVNDNDIVDSNDATLIDQYSQGLITTFPICNPKDLKSPAICKPSGDANPGFKIGLVDKGDALKVLEQSAGLLGPTSWVGDELENADVWQHGSPVHPATTANINSIDAEILLQYIQGLITNFGACPVVNVQSSPVSGFAISGAQAGTSGTTNYSLSGFNVATTLTAPLTANILGTDYSFTSWTCSGSTNNSCNAVFNNGNDMLSSSITVIANYIAAAATPIPPPGSVSITSCSIAPTTVSVGGNVTISANINNGRATTITTQSPYSGFVYSEGQDFNVLGFPATGGRFRIGADLLGSLGYPYRWGWGTSANPNATLASGGTTTITGNITMNTAGTKTFQVGLVEEDVAWLQQNQCQATVTVSTTAPTPTPTPGPTFTISGNVFVDDGAGGGTINNGVKDGGELSYTGSTLTITRTGGSTTTTTGNYSFTNLAPGTYTITLTLPPGYSATNPNTVSITVGPDTTVNFGILFNPPTYTISGNVFVDTNRDGLKNGAETNYTAGPITITFSTGSALTPTLTYPTPPNPSGRFTVSRLTAGTHTIYYTNLPSGYKRIYPITNPPPQFTVTVGPPCTPGGAVSGSNSATYDASCNIINLNFAIAQYPWIQSTRTDIRFDNGFDYYIPSTATAACGGPYASIIGSGATPGIIFTGNSNAIFGQGSASSTNWVVGGINYPELFTPIKGNIIRTSYNYMNAQIKQAGLTPVNVPGCGINNCVLSEQFGHGLYLYNGNLTLSGPGNPKSYSFLGNSNYVILVSGNLTIESRIIVPTGSTVTFIVSGNITVDPTVGNNTGDITTTTPQIEGFYSADNSFIIQGTNNCSVGTDKRLNIAGSVIVNAGLGGGTFQNNRDLCAGNVSCPVFSIQERPDFILNAPDLIKYKNTIYREEAP